ncbi:MAG: hypothetical protein QGI46_10265 [Planctomycetota bacterium]|nr:hypothetical protein [Planctomycetota bacterium]
MRSPIPILLAALLGGAPAPAAGAAAQSGGLVGHWRLDRSHLAGGLFEAEAGQRTLAVPEGALPVFAGEGKSECLVLAPGFGHLEIDPRIDPERLPAERISLEAWVCVHRPQQWGAMLCAVEDNGSYERGWVLGFNHSQFTFAVATEKGGKLTYLKSKTSFVPGEWYHVAGTYDGAVQRIFVNGRLEAEATDQGGAIAYHDVHQLVAASYRDLNENYPLIGGLYELRLYDRAVPERDLRRRYERVRKLLPAVIIEDARPPARPLPPPLSSLQPAIDAAIDRGADDLLRRQHRDGSWSAHIEGYRNGATALMTLALLESGVRADHPSVRQALRFLRRRAPQKTYSMGCQLLALAALDDPKLLPWIQELADELAAWEHPTARGRWGYPTGNEDLSCTQFAALGLWSAARAGAKVPRELWLRVINGLQAHQGEPGEVAWNLGPSAAGRTGKRSIAGFTYRPDSQQTGSMTTAGIGVLTLAEQALGSHLPRRYRRPLEASRQRGIGWLETFYSVERNPGLGGNRYYYYLYGLERAGALLAREELAGRPWYRDGAEVLIGKQEDEGDWGSETHTAFALLFLSRATSAAHTGPGLTGDGRSVSVADADVHLSATGESLMTIWIEGFDADLLAEYAKVEAGATPGLRIVRVEYLADSRIVHTVEVDPKRPWSTERFAFQHRFTQPGKHRLQARVHALAPGSDPAFPGELDELESRSLLVETVVDSREWMETNLELAGENLLEGAGAQATASSGENAGHALDGLAPTHWVCDAKDEDPWLRIDLPRSVRADTLLLAPATSSIATSGDFDALRRANVRINDVDLEVRFPENDLGQAVVELPKPMRVRRIEVHIADHSRGKRNRGQAGFSEVELRLRGG